jgi:hypothetical protein
MSRQRVFTFVVAVNNKDVFQENFLASPCLREPHRHEILMQENARSASKTFNSAMERAVNDLVVFAHQDMFFPDNWLSELNRSLDILERQDPNWGVLGCYGVTQGNEGRGYLYGPGKGFLGKPFEAPRPVQTLDEIVLILRRSSELKFNESLTGFHLYGPDICLVAAEKGLQNYAVSAFSIHNAQLNLILPGEFYRAYKEFKKIWRRQLPVQTPCIRITRFDMPMRLRQLREAYLKLVSGKQYGVTRVKDPSVILDQIQDQVLETATEARDN